MLSVIDCARAFYQGYLLNSSSDETSMFVPYMAPYVLRRFLMHQQAASSLHPVILSTLWDMLHIQELDTSNADPVSGNAEEDGVPRPSACQASEKFHALFEVLRSHLRAGKHVRLGELYPSSMVHPSQKALLNLDVKMVACSLRELDSQLAPLSATESAEHFGSVVVPAANNPGFYVLIPLEESGGAAVMIEVRYSKAESKSALSITDVQKKFSLMTQSCDVDVSGSIIL
jgi:hypothetical protein